MSQTTSEINFDAILDDIRVLLESNQPDFVRNILVDMHAADISELMERLDSDNRNKLFQLLPSDVASEVLTETEDALRENILEELDPERIAKLVTEMESDDAVDVVSDLSPDRATEVLSQIEEEYSEEIQGLLHYPEDSAGGIMATEYVAINARDTVAEGIEELRRNRDEVGDIYQFYVIDDDRVLVGIVSLKEMLLADPNVAIRDVMNEQVYPIGSDTDQEEVAQIFAKYNLVSAPVVDAEHRLIGRITIDDVVDVINEETDEDIAKIAGISEEEILEESVFKVARARLPWLIVAFFGEILSAFIMDFYSVTIQLMVASAFFIPVVMAMGGSTGQQSGFIVVRGLATGEITPRDLRRRLAREARTALISGFVIASLIFGTVFLWQQDYHFAGVLAMTLMIIIMNASLFGAIIPFIFKKFNVDPALASGPLVATFNDVIGLLIYFSLLTGALQYGIL